MPILAGDPSPECPEILLWTALLEAWFPTFVFLLCRDQAGSKKPTDHSQVGTGSPTQKEKKPTPLVVPSAKQESGTKDISFVFILLVRQVTSISTAMHRGGEEYGGKDSTLVSGIFALYTCFGSAFIWRAVLPQGEVFVFTVCFSSARQLARFHLFCLA